MEAEPAPPRPSDPAAFRDALRKAREFAARARAGERVFTPLADREFERALATVPPEEAAHLDLLEVAVLRQSLEVLRLQYELRHAALPFAAAQRERILAISTAGGPGGTTARARAAGVPRWVLAVLAVMAVIAIIVFSRMMDRMAERLVHIDEPG